MNQSDAQNRFDRMLEESTVDEMTLDERIMRLEEQRVELEQLEREIRKMNEKRAAKFDETISAVESDDDDSKSGLQSQSSIGNYE